MGDSGSTTSQRARQMRQVLVRCERSGLTPREFGQPRGIPLTSLTWWWWRQVFQRAGEHLNAASKSVPPAARWCSQKCLARDRSNDTIRCGDRPAQRACGAGAGGSRYRHQVDGRPVQSLQGIKHWAVFSGQPLPHMQAKIRVYGDKMGIEGSVMNLRQRNTVSVLPPPPWCVEGIHFM
jgi:hypothetical protein